MLASTYLHFYLRVLSPRSVGHTMVQGIFELFSLDGKRDGSFELHKNFFNLFEYDDKEGLGMEKILSGLIRQVSKR